MQISVKTFILVVLFLAHGQNTFCQPSAVTKGKGFLLYTINTSNVKAKIAIIDPSVLKPKVVGYTLLNTDGVSPLDAFYSKEEPQIVLGSGFVLTYYPMVPNGFLKINNEVINPINSGTMSSHPKGYSSVLGIKNEKIVLISRNSKEVALLTEGFQTGPKLITDGVKEKLSNIKAKRSFLGTTSSGFTIVGITIEQADLNDIATFLINPPKPYNNLRCTNALNLSGGGSESLVLRTSGKKEEIIRFGNAKLNGAALITFVER